MRRRKGKKRKNDNLPQKKRAKAEKAQRKSNLPQKRKMKVKHPKKEKLRNAREKTNPTPRMRRKKLVRARKRPWERDQHQKL